MNDLGRQIQAEFRGSEVVCKKVITLFQLISNKTRFRIVCVLARGEFCVSDIVEIVCEGTLSNVSQQLKILALAGVVERRRDQQRVLYSLKDDRIRNMIAFLREQFLSAETTPTP